MKLTQYNDPIYGFITIPSPFLGKLINHPYIQRLRRIKQMGLSFLVFPSTEHTRFQHALGSMHLASKAIISLRNKNIDISENEAEALYCGMLLHDLGHGPFSHALEHELLHNISHEKMSLALMNELNIEFDGKLDLTIKMFNNSYKRNFFHQLISSHIDLDRLDYLKRDSFYSGVTEGNINSERLISMMNVYENELVFDIKAIHSIEKFLLARRMMYWSLYLHKTSFIAEELLIRFFKRLKSLAISEIKKLTSPALFNLILSKSENINKLLHYFVQLDDSDIDMTLKSALGYKDFVLKKIASAILERRLPKILTQKSPFDKSVLMQKQKFAIKEFNLNKNIIDDFVFSGNFFLQAYDFDKIPIKLYDTDGNVQKFNVSSDLVNFSLLKKKDYRYFLAFPK